MNLPNKLTVIRLILTFVFVGLMAAKFPHAKTIGLIVFAVAAFTDFLDGYLARKHNLITNFGKLMDPLADKILMCGGFVMLCSAEVAASVDGSQGLIPAWIVIVILTREFLVTGLRLVASAEGIVLAAENLGKHKTTWQIITIIYFLVFLASEEPAFSWIRGLFEWKWTGPDFLGQLLIWASLILTILSGCSYAWKNRELLKDC